MSTKDSSHRGKEASRASRGGSRGHKGGKGHRGGHTEGRGGQRGRGRHTERGRGRGRGGFPYHKSTPAHANIEDIPIVSPEAKFEEDKIEGKPHKKHSKGSSKQEEYDFSKYSKGGSYENEGYDYDDFGYFDEYGYFDEVGYYDDKGYYYFDENDVQIYFDPNKKQKKHHSRGGYNTGNFNEDFKEVKQPSYEEKKILNKKDSRSSHHKKGEHVRGKGEHKGDHHKGEHNKGGNRKHHPHEDHKGGKHRGGHEKGQHHKDEGRKPNQHNKKKDYAEPEFSQKSSKSEGRSHQGRRRNEPVKFEEAKIPKGDHKMKFINDYQSKYADFEAPVFYHQSQYFKSHWSEKVKIKKSNKVKKEKVDKKKYDKFLKNFGEITLNVSKNTEKASLEATKKIYKTINKKVFEPSEEEKKYFDRYGLPHSVMKHKKVFSGSKDFEAYYDKDTVESGLAKGDFLEANFRMNEFNKRVAFVSVEGLENDVIILSEKDQNRALDRDLVVVKLIDPKWWEPMKNHSNSGQDNNKPIEELIEENQKEGSKPSENPLEENKGDEPLDVEKESEEDGEVEDDLKEPAEGESEEEVIQEKEELSEPESENDKTVLEIFRDKQRQRKEKKDKKEDRQESGLNLPSTINSQEEMIEWMNTIAKDFRPKGKVVHIKESNHFDKDIVMILRIGDKTWIQKVAKSKKEEKERLIKEAKQDPKNIVRKLKMMAVPINKRLKWGFIDDLPEEFWSDVLSGEDPCKRYYLARYTSWKPWANNPSANIYSNLGSAGDIGAETMRILKQYDLFEAKYPEEVLNSLKKYEKDINEETKEWKIPEEEFKKRVDLRDTRIFTIDPASAKDLDDALSVTKIEDDVYEIGVHIADVSYFVEQGTALDKEARSRATSVYFVHLVIPMLPRLLCENLCSLNQKVERLAYSIFFRLRKDGSLIKEFEPRIHRSVIKSCAKWNYDLVQDILDKKITDMEGVEEELRPENYSFEEMADDCFILNEIAHNRRRWRFETGSISVENPEYYFELDENNQPMQFNEQKKIESKELIEEYMLLANMLVSEYLVKFCKDKAVLRTQLPPKEERKEDMIDYFCKVGAEIDISTSLSTQKSFQKLKAGDNTALYYCCMRKYFSNIREANYVTREEIDPQEARHYSLNFDLYTHFTSPIRRYPDLLVHRQLTLALAHQEETRSVIEGIDYKKFVEYCSDRYLTAKYASSTCTKLYHCIFLKNTQVNEGVDAYVYDMTANSIMFYIASINVNYKMDIRKDDRIAHCHIQDNFTAYILFKKEGQEGEEEEEIDFEDDKVLDDESIKERLVKIKILEVVKLVVGTTNEIPIDLKCLIYRSENDFDLVREMTEEVEAEGNEEKKE